MTVGPNEQRVRDSLEHRPAGLIHALAPAYRDTFAGLFNGALQGWITPQGGLFVGKAECEWHWPEAWDGLKRIGLIHYITETKPNHPDIGGETTRVLWNITEKGRLVREDDMNWFRELLEARDQDEKMAVS